MLNGFARRPKNFLYIALKSDALFRDSPPEQRQQCYAKHLQRQAGQRRLADGEPGRPPPPRVSSIVPSGMAHAKQKFLRVFPSGEISSARFPATPVPYPATTRCGTQVCPLSS